MMDVETYPEPGPETAGAADPPPTPRIAIGYRTAIFVLGILAAQIVLGVLGVLAAGMYFAVTGEGEDLEAMMARLESPGITLKLTIVMALPILALSLAWIFACRKFFDRRPFEALGFGKPAWGWGKTILLGTFVGAFPILTGIAVLWVSGGLLFTGVSTSIVTWLLFPTLLVMAFFEEAVFRGYILGNFLEERRFGAGLLTSSILFALVHGLNPEVWSSFLGPLNLFGAGLVLGAAYLATRDLWFPTVLHFVWNLTQGVIFELPVSGLQTDGILDVELTGALPGWLTGEGFGLEASVLMTLAEIVMVIFLLRLAKRQGRYPGVSPADGSATESAA